MSLETSISIAKSGTNSLRATVPEGVVAYLGLQAGDKLEWRMEIDKGQKVVVVTKASSNNKTMRITSKYVKKKVKP